MKITNEEEYKAADKQISTLLKKGLGELTNEDERALDELTKSIEEYYSTESQVIITNTEDYDAYMKELDNLIILKAKCKLSEEYKMRMDILSSAICTYEENITSKGKSCKDGDYES